jgi:hypothetical protein
MSDATIEVLGRASRIRYRQGVRSVDVDSELLIGTPMLVLYGASIRAWTDGKAVTADEKAEIIANIRRLMRPEWGEIDVK